MKLTISVTKEIIEKSKYCTALDGSNCAIAIALKDIFPLVAVGITMFKPFGPYTNEVSLPKEASDFINSFDHNFLPEHRIKMKPFSFDIDLPDWVIEKIDISELQPLLVNHPNLTLHEV